MITNKYYVYILTNIRKTVLYIGVTDNLRRRVKQHKRKYKGFTARYNVTELVYYESQNDKEGAYKKEKQLKNLLRRKKEILINKSNPEWKDLYKNILKSP